MKISVLVSFQSLFHLMCVCDCFSTCVIYSDKRREKEGPRERKRRTESKIKESDVFKM